MCQFEQAAMQLTLSHLEVRLRFEKFNELSMVYSGRSFRLSLSRVLASYARKLILVRVDVLVPAHSLASAQEFFDDRRVKLGRTVGDLVSMLKPSALKHTLAK